jgi:hypothetical protein
MLAAVFSFTGQNEPTLIDDFDRGDSATLGLSWQESVNSRGSGLEIVSNTVESTAVRGCAAWTPISASELFVSYEIATYTENGSFLGPISFTRAGATTEGYNLDFAWNPGFWNIVFYYNGTNFLSTAINAIATMASTDKIGAHILDSGSSVTVLVYHRTAAGNWSLIATRTDGARNVPGPYHPGIAATGPTVDLSFDDFRAQGPSDANPLMIVQPIAGFGASW